jgi:large subunit ribosomal protein L24
MNKLHIKTGDTVVVISGDSKGTRGKVIATSPEEGKVIVAGANIVSKHTKARKQGENSSIVKTEGAMYASKVQLVCPKCDKGVRTKVQYVTKGDKKIKVRVCTKCGAEI